MPVLPFWKMSEETRKMYYQQAVARARALAIEKNLGKTPSDIIVREIVPGHSGHADGINDLPFDNASTNQAYWEIPAASLTANRFSSILPANTTVDEKQCLVFFGIIDHTPNPDGIAIRFKSGNDIKEMVQFEEIYADEPAGGIFVDENGNLMTVEYGPKDPIQIDVLFKTATAKQLQILGFVAEPVGRIVTSKQV